MKQEFSCEECKKMINTVDKFNEKDWIAKMPSEDSALMEYGSDFAKINCPVWLESMRIIEYFL